jgi:L-ascorbate metabolism protein UlaG (beta-lactamase superfamily)
MHANEPAPRTAPPGLLRTLRDLPAALGARLTGARADRALRSPHYHDGSFHNDPFPTVTGDTTDPGGPSAPTGAPGTAGPGAVAGPGGAAGRSVDFSRPKGSQVWREMRGKQQRKPLHPIPVLAPTMTPPDRTADGLQVIWFGHASILVEIEGARVLIDPLWSERCSPVQFAGPRRLHEMPLPVDRLGSVDAIVISHDHYDHLDLDTIRALARTQTAPFLVPIGVGAHLDRWGVSADRIIELDWDEGVDVAGLRLTATAAHHFSGRGLSRNPTLWSSWVIAGARRKVFYTGDSGYFPGYARIGAEYGPFDLSLVQIGAYSPAWPDIHMYPEEAVAAHLDLRADLLIPVHWATFVLAFHAWDEPVDRLWREANARGVRLAVPRPGERVDVDAPPAVDGWWRTLMSSPAPLDTITPEPADRD